MPDIFLPNPDVQTEWDSSKATLQRIDRILQACSNSSFNRNYPAWYSSLDVLKREVIVKMNHTRDKKKKKKITDELEEQMMPQAQPEQEEEEVDPTKPQECPGFCARCHTIKLLKAIRNNILIYLNATNKRQMESEMEEKLDEAEIFLREFMDKKGMLMKESKTAIERFQYG